MRERFWERYPPKTPAWLIFFAISALLFLFPIYPLTRPVIAAVLAGRPLPSGLDWPGLIGCDLFLLYFAIGVIWLPLRQMLTVFTADGIRQTQYLGLRRVTLPWAAITEVHYHPGTTGLGTTRLRGSQGTISITFILYRDPKRVFNEVWSNIPPSARRT